MLVDPTDPHAIAEAIVYLLEHPDEARRMGENGRKAVLDRYNWGEMEKRLLGVYRQVEKGEGTIGSVAAEQNDSGPALLSRIRDTRFITLNGGIESS